MSEPRWLNLELRDSSGEPFSRRRFAIRFDAGPLRRGELDGDGRLSIQVPPRAERARLTVAYRCLELLLGQLPAPGTVAGAQERLNQLHFFAGPSDGDLGPSTAHALRRFQRARGLAETGALDPATSERLAREHGS